jgi:hypothetical protein
MNLQAIRNTLKCHYASGFTTGCLEAGDEGGAKAGGTASQVVGGVGQAHQAACCEAHLQLCQTKQLLARYEATLAIATEPKCSVADPDSGIRCLFEPCGSGIRDG